MPRPIHVLAAAALAAALAVPALASPGSASAAPPTCDGLPATILGTSPGALVGTDGDDVIVTAGATSVRAGAGDDHVCVVGAIPANGALGIDLGPGDDVADATHSGLDRVIAILGAGDDVFRGGAERDDVGDYLQVGSVPSVATPSGQDAITTGAGDDRVWLGSYAYAAQAADPVADHVALGTGDDQLELWSRIAPGFSAVGGGGRDVFNGWSETEAQHREVGAWRFDTASGQITRGPSSWGWTSFEQVAFRMDDVVFSGSPADEQVYSEAPPISVDLGAGDDSFEAGYGLTGTSAVAGGPGHDVFRDDALPAGRTTIDLPAGLLRDDDRLAPDLAIPGFEAVAALGGQRVTVIGTSAANEVQVASCHNLVVAGGGDDWVRAGLGSENNYCRTASVELRGGPGADRLVGTAVRAPDRLIGGPGRDRADGRGGRHDLCRAEVRRHCERR